MTSHYSARKSFTVIASSSILAIAMVITGANISASISASNTITACANKKTGAIRQITKGKCTNKETALSWNKSGVQGARGPAGQNAPASVALSAKRTFYGVIQTSGCGEASCRTSEVWNLAEEGPITSKTASSLVLPSAMLVQSSAEVKIRVITDQIQDGGYIYCYVVAANVSDSTDQYALGNGYANVSDSNTLIETRTNVTAIGGSVMPAGTYNVSIICQVTGSQAEIATAGVMVNLIGSPV